MAADAYLDLRLRDWLDEIGKRRGPGAGAVAGIAAAMAAALAELAAGASKESWVDAAGVAAQAQALQRRLIQLGWQDAQAYAAAMERLHGGFRERTEIRNFALGEALSVAADLPLAIAEAAADVAALAAVTVEHGLPELRADAAAAAALAEGCARAAAKLVEVNLATQTEDERIVRARGVVTAAAHSAGEALAAVE